MQPKNSLSTSKNQYPCPDCVNYWPRQGSTPGTGKVVDIYIDQMGRQRHGGYITCPRCGGSGMVAERRNGGHGERRKGEERRVTPLPLRGFERMGL